MWHLNKEKNKIANITYSVIEKTYRYKDGNKRFPLCLAADFPFVAKEDTV